MNEFKLFGYKNELDKKTYDEMYSILHDNFLNRELYQNYDSEETPYDIWYDTIKNIDNYYELLYYIDNELAGYICFMYQERGLMISEVQIKQKYKGKNTLKEMLKKLLEITDKSNFNNIFCTISDLNEKSKAVFKHIGMIEISNELYEIKREDLLKWIGNNFIK